MVKHAKKKVKILGLKYVEKIFVGDIQRLSDYFEPNSFDYITSTCVFCFVPAPIECLREVKKIKKKTEHLFKLSTV